MKTGTRHSVKPLLLLGIALIAVFAAAVLSGMHHKTIRSTEAETDAETDETVLETRHVLLPEAASLPDLIGEDPLPGTEAQTAKPAPVLSVDSGFFTEAVSVELSFPGEGTIFYTLDGSLPDAKARRYQGPIELSCPSSFKCHVIRARVQLPDGSWSGECAGSYFVGKAITERFDMPVFSIVSDAEGLYGPDGIFTQYENRGREAERDCHVDFLSAEGELLLEQFAGLRIHGAGSRKYAMKSLRLYARKDYDEEGWFNYPFFGEDYSEQGTLITRYKQIILRNSGSDYNRAMCRDPFAQTLAAEAGFAPVQKASPCAVYLNGEYYGFCWIREYYNDAYFESHYGEFAGTFEISDGKEKAVPGREENIEFPELAKLDLKKEENFQKVKDTIDLEQYLFFYAVNTLIDNEDWPQWNSFSFRYVPAEGEDYGEGVFDGRWRFMLRDTDWCLGHYGLHPIRESLKAIMDKTLVRHHSETLDLFPYSPLFTALMKREDCRKMYVSYVERLVKSSFTKSNMNALLSEFIDMQRNELGHHFKESKAVAAGKTYKDTYLPDIQVIREWCAKIESHLMKQISDIWGYSKTFILGTSCAGRSQVLVDGITLSHTTRYMIDIPVTLTPQTATGERFKAWVCNGETITDETLVLQGFKSGTEVNVELLVESVGQVPAEEISPLVIDSYSARKDWDCILVKNISEESIDLSAYALSDGGHTSLLPQLQLPAGEVLPLYGRSYPGTVPAEQRLAFDLKVGETLSLFLGDHPADEVPVVKLQVGSFYVRDYGTDSFREVLP